MAKAYKKSAKKVQKAEEPQAVYRSVKKLPAVADFTYKQFEKIASQLPLLTQKDWANILHLSERTIQRYSKENKHFEGIYVDRILQIQELIELGLNVFNNPEALYEWLSKNKKVMGSELNFESLYTTRGIRELSDQLVRIQQGIYA